MASRAALSRLTRPMLAVLALAMAIAGLAVLGQRPAHAANAKPLTIPALQQWTGGNGSYRLAPASRIVRNTRDASALAATSQTLADDLKALTHNTIGQQIGTPTGLRPGDIFLSLGRPDGQLGSQGYALSVANKITISAPTDTGVFNGTRTVLQLLHQGNTIPQGSARDWPVKPERGLMIDDGRKFFTKSWIESEIQELAYLKLNVLHLHLSDNLGFRIESDTHPEIVSPDHLSKQDVRDILALAARYHITVIPEIDMPGHMDTILAAHPDLKLVGADGVVNNGYIDLSNDKSYQLMKDLITEYLPLFPGPYWHIGADEYITNYADYPQLLTYARVHYGQNAMAKDVYYGFVNWADGLVRAAGKTTRMWNDGIGSGDGTIKPNPDIVVDYWTTSGLSPQQLVAAGHTIDNGSWDPTYYVLGGSRPNEQWGYETWTPDLFQGNQTLAATDAARNLGSEVHVWCDHPDAQTQDQVAAGINNILRIVAQQTWSAPKLVGSYAEFESVMGAIGRNPGWPIQVPTTDLALNRPATASSVETPDFPASNAVDGDYGSRWSSNYTDHEWLQVDLGAIHRIGEVKLTWETAYGKAYQIQTSTDGSTWTTIYATSTGTGGVNDLTGLTGSGRYVRMQGVQRGTVYGYSLYELEVYV